MSVRSSLPSRYHALVAGALAVTFVPFGIPALSYNTFAEGFFAAGSFLAFAGSASKDRRLLVTAGACVGLGVFAYPPIAVGARALVAGVGLRQRRGVRGVVALAAPILLIGAFALAFFLSDGFGRAPSTSCTSRASMGTRVGASASSARFVWMSSTDSRTRWLRSDCFSLRRGLAR